MASLRLILVSFLLSAMAGAESVSDAVNERIPVSKAELEAHWQIDCRASWAGLADKVTGVGAGEHCGISAATRRVLELCAVVYQPPGEALSPNCPDYRAALAALDAAEPAAQCAAVADLLRGTGSCSRPGAAD
jgi:hypothetical protein